jgi:23S rRNA (pseudouridine1915-N3)-methyltransferase
MRIQLVAVGTKMPTWVKQGFEEYAKRFSQDVTFRLNEVPASKRTKQADITRLLKKEGELVLAQIPDSDKVVTMEVEGKLWDSHQLSQQLKNWQEDRQNISILIGGADGLAQSCMQRSEHRWSLSPLTLPHYLVRILVAESLYRAWSIIKNHPYHRD